MLSNDAGYAAQPTWRKASFCASGECVEVAQRDGAIILRDSTQPSDRMLRYDAGEWRSFIHSVKTGAFSLRHP
jgi:hypothetical protein